MKDAYDRLTMGPVRIEPETKCELCDKPAVWWLECTNCDEGFSHHDCMEDCCCCLDPEPNVVCDLCLGQQGWYRCVDCIAPDCENAIPID